MGSAIDGRQTKSDECLTAKVRRTRREIPPQLVLPRSARGTVVHTCVMCASPTEREPLVTN